MYTTSPPTNVATTFLLSALLAGLGWMLRALTAGAAARSRGWFGEYLNVPVVGGLSAYADAVHTVGRRAWYPVADPVLGATFAQSGMETRGLRTTVLAGLRYEDQVFVGEFVRCHGSIKHMEKAFGVSYPTIKNRLNRIAARLQLVQIDVEPVAEPSDEVLDLLERGEITALEAAERLRR